MGEAEGVNVHVGDRVGPFVVVASEATRPARKRRVVVRCAVCERVSEMNERSLLDKRTEEQRACAKCRVYTTNGTWTKGWVAKMENAAKENARLREELETVKRERDLALGRLENEIKAANQARMAEERARESLDELDSAIYECLPSDYDDDSPLDCVEHAADRLRDLAQERDEWRDKYHALDQTAGELCDACGWAFKIPGEPCRCEVVRERDEARTELSKLRKEYDSVLEANVSLLDGAPYVNARNAYRRGAEAMREACAEETRRVFDVFQGYPPSLEVLHVLRAMPIPEET